MPTRPLTQQQKSSILEKWFPGLEIIEETSSMLIKITKEDVRNGIPGDPCNCAFALAWRRCAGSPLALILGLYAYVQLTDSDSIERVHKFSISQRMKRAISHFDKTREMPTYAYEFQPISKNKRMNRLAAQKRKSRTKASKRGSPIKRVRDRPITLESARTNIFRRGPSVIERWPIQDSTK